MGKYSKGVKVRDPDGEEATIIGKESGGYRILKYGPELGYSDGFTMTYHKSELEVVANDNEVSACAPVFEKEYSVGDRVRFIRDNPNGGAEFGAAGQEAVVLRVYDNKSTTYGQQVELEDFGCGFPPDAPVSALELIPTPVVTPTFAKGDRALSQNGDYVTVDTDPDDVDHVWVSFGTTKWRTPVSWLTKWEPKVGDRVRYKDECVEGEGEIVADVDYETSAYDWTVKASGEPGAFFYMDNRFPFRTRLFATSSLEPLPVAEQPAAEPAEPAPLVVEAGKSYVTRDGRKASAERDDEEDHFPIRGTLDGREEVWERNGSWWFGGAQHAKDLVAEWVEPAVEVAVAEPEAAPTTYKVGDEVLLRGGSTAKIIHVRTPGQIQSGSFPFVHDGGDGSWHAVDADGRSCIGKAALDIVSKVEPAAPPAKFKVGDRVTLTAPARISGFDKKNAMVLLETGGSFALPIASLIAA